MQTFFTFWIAFSIAVVSSRPSNDWSKPCFEGECAYDLPESAGSGSIKICGRGPFARIAAASIASEQSIPSHIAKRLEGRNPGLPKVHALQLDAAFEKIDTSRWGNIFFSITAENEPSVEARSIETNLTINSIPERARLHSKTFQLMTTQDQVAQSQSRMVASNSMVCGGKQASFGIELGNRLNGTIYTGFAANGTLAPPKITNFESFVGKFPIILSGTPIMNNISGFSGNASAHFSILASLTSSVSKHVELWHQTTKPISIPGILDLQSSFDVTAHMQAAIGLPVRVNLTMDFVLDDVQVWYPPRPAEDSNHASLSKTSTNINILNGTNGRAVIDGHIQPKIRLRVEAFSGKSELDVELGVDMYTAIDIDAGGTSTSQQPVIAPTPGPSKTRSVVTSGWAGVKGGIALNSSFKEASWGSNNIKDGSLLKKEWNISNKMPSVRPSFKKAAKGRSKPVRQPDSTDSEDCDSDNGGVDEKGMERLMSALGDDGLDEFDRAQLGLVVGSDSEEEEDGSESEVGEADGEDSAEEVGDEEEGEQGADDSDEGMGEAAGGSSAQEGDEDSDGVDDAEDEEIALDELDGGELDEDVVPKQKVEIDDTVAMQRIRETIQLDPKMPWTETLVLNYPETIDVDVSDDLNRELAFYKQALHGANTARSLAAKHNLPFTRPSDYFAEMVKSDSHMERIRQRMLDEGAGIKKSEEKRREREGKKFGKQVQIEKLKERERGRKEMDERLKGLKRKRGDMLDKPADDDSFDVAVEDAISDRPSKRGKPQVSRKSRDQKFGFGGADRRSKQNTRESTDNFVSGSRQKGRGPRGSGPKGSSSKRSSGGNKRPGKSKRMASRSK
ncbi:rRNA-processing protein and EBNA1-binding protein ebp2 [Pleurotus pulmonarius]|nr:rRNA-processing protein and EBNA1-binding protein ebp2 [Pleurotus pulmonarius]